MDSESVWFEQLIGRLEAGSPAAQQEVWDRFFEPLAARVRARLAPRFRRVADEEDVALSALNSLFRRLQEGRFSLHTPDDLWRLLLRMASRKAIDRVKREKTRKRGGGQVRGDSVRLQVDDDSPQPVGEPSDQALSPEMELMFLDEVRRLLDLLSDASLERVAALKLEGYTNVEISERLDCSSKTIERKLSRIRKIWLVAGVNDGSS